MSEKNCEHCRHWVRFSSYTGKPTAYDCAFGHCVLCECERDSPRMKDYLARHNLTIDELPDDFPSESPTCWNNVCDYWEKKKGITLYLDIRMCDPIGVDADDFADGLRKLADKFEKTHLDEDRFIIGNAWGIQVSRHKK